MGMETRQSVKTSAVGVISAAMIKIITIACRLYSFNKSELISPSFAKKNAIIGISNSKPNNNESNNKVDTYDESAI